MRLQHRKDESHNDFVERLEAGGWLVFDTHNISGFVDAIAVRHGRILFLEFKSTAKDYGKDKARAAKQAVLHEKLRAAGAEVFVIRSVADVQTLETAA